MRVELPRRPRRPAVFLLMIGVMMASCARDKSYAQAGKPETQATLVFFAEHKMREGEWSALFEALRRGVGEEAAETPELAGGVELLRGDRLASGVAVSQPISVYLHGDCLLLPIVGSPVSGALGWVRRVHGRIEPFIHVDCEKIALELSPRTLGMNRERKDEVMGEAMARVIIHEWVHVATQSAHHSRHGVEKATFDAGDLLADDADVRRNPGS